MVEFDKRPEHSGRIVALGMSAKRNASGMEERDNESI